MDRLGRGERDAVLLRFYRGMSLKEVAAAIGITGKWDSVAIDNPPPPGPGGGCTVAQDVAAYVDGYRVHGYGAPAGKWDTLTLPREGDPPQVTLAQNTVRVVHGKTFHVFSAKTGKWTQPPFQIQSP
jgi:hypothetical protein